MKYWPIIIAVLIATPAGSQTLDLNQRMKSQGPCSPNIGYIGGDLIFNNSGCGLPQDVEEFIRTSFQQVLGSQDQIFAILSRLVGTPDLEKDSLASSSEVIIPAAVNSWARKYQELLSKLVLDNSTQTALSKGNFQKAGNMLDQRLMSKTGSSNERAAIHHARALLHELHFQFDRAIFHYEQACNYDATVYEEACKAERRLYGQPVKIRGQDDALMRLIPEGLFYIKKEYHPFRDKFVELYLDAFYIDVYKVTNRQYAKFLKENPKFKPKYWDKLSSNSRWVEVAEHDLALPVIGVTLEAAKAYCHWAGKRLPRETEWVKAGRGIDTREYTWGDSSYDVKSKGQWEQPEDKFFGSDRENILDKLRPVGSFPHGQSPYGIHDMLGYPQEWVEGDWTRRFDPYKRDRVDGWVRGGSFGLDWSGYTSPSDQHPDVGFRCAADARSNVSKQLNAKELPKRPSLQRPDKNFEPAMPPQDVPVGKLSCSEFVKKLGLCSETAGREEYWDPIFGSEKVRP